MPFDSFRDLCARFEVLFSDEHCAFICATYLVEIDQGNILINFKEFLADLRDSGHTRDGSRLRSDSINSEESAGDIRRALRASSTLSSKTSSPLMRSANYRSMDEEKMLDIAEAIFMKMADLLNIHKKTTRAVFSKFCTPEVMPDRSVIELMSPIEFLEGVHEVGIDDLTQFEASCMMRVLAKPELDNGIILNEFVLIMENFGVPDSLEDDETENDYIPDTEESVLDLNNGTDTENSGESKKPKES